MSLATTCPTCKTTFRVVPDQLKLRRGLVRCGACHCVFSGVDALRHLPNPAAADPHPRDEPLERDDPLKRDEPLERDDGGEMAAPLADIPPAADDAREPEPIADAPPDDPPAPESEPAAGDVLTDGQTSPDPWAPLRSFPEPAEAETAESDRDMASEIESDVAQEFETDAAPEFETDAAPEFEADVASGLNSDIAPEGVVDPSASDSGESFPASGTALPAQVEEDEEDAIDFFATGSGRRVGWRPRRTVARSIALALGLVLAAQLALGGRDWLAAYFPQARPWLEAIARPFGLQVELLRRPDAVTIESFELTSSDVSGSYRLSALLRSRADTAVQWPAIELSLTDASGAIVVRRVLTARDYIANPSVVSAGLPARSEHPVVVGLEFGDLTPTGYSALLFYP